MIPDHVLDHVDQGLLRLLNQFKGRPRIAAWNRAYLNQCQKLEDAIFDVLIKRTIDAAEGVQLDALGRIVGELRDDLPDDDYRIFILARIYINKSQGHLSDVLKVLAYIISTPVRVFEYPACIAIESSLILARDPVVVYNHLRQTKAGGIKLSLVVPTSNTAQAKPNSVLVTASGSDGAITTLGLTSSGASFERGIIGGKITISGAANAANNGTFPITDRPDGTHVVFTNANLVYPDANSNSIVYSIVNGVAPLTNNPLFAVGDANVTQASLTSSVGPYALADGDTLTLVVNGTTETVTFIDDDFVDITAATAAEVRAVLDALIPALDVSGTTAVTIKTYTRGTTATLHVTGGTANAALGFSTSAVTGTGDTTFGLLSDAVSLRDPHAPPPEIAGVPIISYIEPDNGDEL